MINIKNFLPLSKNKIPTLDQELWLKQQEIKTFIDIGAYVGEYVDYAYRLYPKANIYAFEPLLDSYNLLVKKKNYIKNLYTYNIALGNKKYKSTFYRSSYAPSSSILQMGISHKKNFPHTANLKKEYVKVDTLDNVFRKEELKTKIFVKIDTQGYEDRVIKGGEKTLKRTAIIQTEVSFVLLYKGQKLFGDIYNLLANLGFIFCGYRNQILSPKNGKPLQAHVYFINPLRLKL